MSVLARLAPTIRPTFARRTRARLRHLGRVLIEQSKAGSFDQVLLLPPYEREPGGLPATAASFDDTNICEAHLDKGPRRKRRLSAAAADQHDFLSAFLKRRVAAVRLGIGADFEFAASDVAGTRNRSPLQELPFLSHVDEHDPAAVEQPLRFARRKRAHALTGFVHELAKGLWHHGDETTKSFAR